MAVERVGNMFLVTTADQSTWPQKEKILFLGKWCLRYSQKATWSKLDYEIFPYHWDDRSKLHLDSTYLLKVYEKYLAIVSARLNEIHQSNHSLRYWRILIGPWLYYFIPMIFDRYSSIKKLNEQNIISHTKIINYNLKDFVPLDMCEFEELSNDDTWNHAIYAAVIRHYSQIPFQEIDPISSSIKQSMKRSRSVKDILKIMLGQWSKIFPASWQRLVFSGAGLRALDQLRLQCALLSLPSLFLPKLSVPRKPVDSILRQSIALQAADSEFEKCLEELLFQQIPLAYLEAYKSFDQLVKANYPNKPKWMVTAVDYSANDAFKLWAAEMSAAGSGLIFVQHGGHFGTGLWNHAEEHQIKTADRFYTWGWKTDAPNIKAMPSAKLARVRSLKADKDGYIFCSYSTNPRYSYQLYSIPIAGQQEDYIADQLKFLRLLNAECLSLLKLRAHPCDFGWDMKERLEDAGFAPLLLPSDQAFLSQVSKSRLAIATYNATTYLETFAANIPSLLYWNPQHWELRSAAQPYFDALRKLKILHDSPESAAEFLNEIYADPAAWWQRSDVQQAKNNFCQQFALSSQDWLKQWRDELKQ